VIFAIILSSTLFANENAKESKIKPITLGQYESPEAEESCLQNVLDYLIRNIFSPNEHLLYDYQKKTDFFYHGRLRRAFEAVPDSVLDELFDSKTGLIKSEKELFRIWELIQGDYIKATPAQVEFIGDLYHVNDDYAGIFWNDEVNRAFDVLSTLMKADKKWGYDQGLNETAKFTEMALNEAERIYLQKAVNESQGIKYKNTRNRFMRWLDPEYKRALRYIEHNNADRKRLQLIYKMDEPAEDTLTKYGKYMTTNEQTKIRGLMNDTSGQMADIKKDIKEINGLELSETNTFEFDKVNAKEIDKRIEAQSKSQQKLNETERQAERDMDLIDETIDEIRKRKYIATKDEQFAGERPMAEYQDKHLKIRFSQHQRETPELYEEYLRRTAKKHNNAEYNVEVRWSVERKEKRKGPAKDSNGEYIEEDVWVDAGYVDESDTLHSSYEEILNGKIEPDIDKINVSPSVGFNQRVSGGPSFYSVPQDKFNEMINISSAVRKSEEAFRDQIDQATRLMDEINPETYEKIISDETVWKKTLAEMDIQKEELIKKRELLNSYRKKNNQEIIAQWADDIPEDFRERNDQMYTRIDHMINRIKHVREQVFRKSPLDIQYVMPDHSRASDILRKKWLWARGSQTAIGTGIAGGVGYGIYEKEKVKEESIELWEKLKQYIRPGDEETPYHIEK